VTEAHACEQLTLSGTVGVKHTSANLNHFVTMLHEVGLQKICFFLDSVRHFIE